MQNIKLKIAAILINVSYTMLLSTLHYVKY